MNYASSNEALPSYCGEEFAASLESWLDSPGDIDDFVFYGENAELCSER